MLAGPLQDIASNAGFALVGHTAPVFGQSSSTLVLLVAVISLSRSPHSYIPSFEKLYQKKPNKSDLVVCIQHRFPLVS